MGRKKKPTKTEKEHIYFYTCSFGTVILQNKLRSSSACFESGHQLYLCTHLPVCSLQHCSCSHLRATIQTLALSSSPLPFARLLLLKEAILVLFRKEGGDVGFFFCFPFVVLSLWKGKCLACCQKAALGKCLKSNKSANGKTCRYCGHYRVSVH